MTGQKREKEIDRYKEVHRILCGFQEQELRKKTFRFSGT